jgi:hypothetical protein
MLSFMREQESRNASEHPAPGPGSPGGSAADASGSQEYLTVAANSKSLRRSTMLVVALVGIGLVSLLLMIRRSQPQAAAANENAGDQTRIESAITRLTGVRSEMAGRMDEIVKKFYEFSDVVQVKVNELVKNPFAVEGFAKDLQTSVVLEDPAAQAELVRRQRIEQQAKTLKLLSIMRSAEQGTCCMINDQILRQGDVIAGFTIVGIGGNSVTLAWPSSETTDAGTPKTDEMKTILKLSE